MKKWFLPIVIMSFILLSSLTIAYTGRQEEPKPITLAEFNQHIADKTKPTLVYFHADWCMLCRKMEPVINKADSTYQNLNILRIDTEFDKEITEHFEIDGLPLFMLYNNGRQVWVHVGVISENDLKKKLAYYVAIH